MNVESDRRLVLVEQRLLLDARGSGAGRSSSRAFIGSNGPASPGARSPTSRPRAGTPASSGRRRPRSRSRSRSCRRRRRRRPSSSRPAKRSFSPMLDAVEALGDDAADDDLRRARRGTCAPARSSPAGAARRPSPACRARRGCALVAVALGQRVSTTISFETSGAPSGPRATSGSVSTSDAWSRSTPLWISVCAALPDHDDVVEPSRCDTSVFFSPASSISTAAKTNTTSAMPPAVSDRGELAHPEVAAT